MVLSPHKTLDGSHVESGMISSQQLADTRVKHGSTIAVTAEQAGALQ